MKIAFFLNGFAKVKSKISVVCPINILLKGDVLTAVKKKIFV